MKKRFVLYLAVFIILLVFLQVVSASFTKGNKTAEIETSYSPSDTLRGWINISLTNEPSDSLLTSNSQGSIKLKDFLDKNVAGYSCLPSGCQENYVLSNGQISKSFSLGYGQEKIISFSVTGIVTSINSLRFDVSVGNPLSCINPLKIDLFDDSSVEWKATKFSNDTSCTYNTGTGCFNVNEVLSEWLIVQTPYCEKINLTEGGKFNLGAWVKKGSNVWQAGLLKMSLYDLEGTELTSCNLPEPSINGGEVSCQVNYENDKIQDYYVCINANTATDYKIKRESVNSCGFHAIPGEQTDYYDYYIFAKAAKFDNIGIFRFNQAEYESQENGNLAEDILSYLGDRYGKNCTNGCAVPLRLSSYGSLDIVISNLSLSYSTSGGSPPAENKIYDAVKEPAKINSGFIKLDLSFSNITVPSAYGNKTLELYLKGEKILSQNIYIAKLPVIKSVSPTTVSAAVPTTFKAAVSSPSNANIVSYVWDFGDESDEETTTLNYTVHTYSNTGGYTLALTVEDEDGLISSKSFSIIAGNPKDAANLTLKKYRERITNLSRSINEQAAWYQNELKEQVDIDGLDDKLKSLEKKYSIASGEEDYVEIMSNLSEMRVPVRIGKSSQGSFPVLLDIEDINLDYLEEFGAGSLENGSEEDYKNEILKWYDDNLKVNVDFFTLSAYYDDEIASLMSYFKLKIKATQSDTENYLIVGDNAKINTDLNVREFDDAAGIKFVDLKDRDVEFVVIGDIVPLQLPVYISPEFSRLNASVAGACNFNGVCDKPKENWRNCSADCSPTGWIIFYIIILVVGALIVYIIMQEWYKRKYESHLFKNRNDLFNLVNFINNALAKGMSKQEIEKRLKQVGWNSEQINYAFKKVGGKKLMPIEIDILKILKKKK